MQPLNCEEVKKAVDEGRVGDAVFRHCIKAALDGCGCDKKYGAWLTQAASGNAPPSANPGSGADSNPALSPTTPPADNAPEPTAPVSPPTSPPADNAPPANSPGPTTTSQSQVADTTQAGGINTAAGGSQSNQDQGINPGSVEQDQFADQPSLGEQFQNAFMIFLQCLGWIARQAWFALNKRR